MFQETDSIHKPADAAPVQLVQDSAVSTRTADFTAGKNHWQVKVDSVLMPDAGVEVKAEVKPLPKYYKESFFAKDSLLHSEIHGGRYGIPGDPVPYTIQRDNVLTPVLIFLILLLVFSTKRSWKIYRLQAKHFFHNVRTGSIMEKESVSGKTYLFFAGVYTMVILSLLFYFYAKTYIAETYVTYSEYVLMGFFLAGVMGLWLVESLLQQLVNYVFFPPRERSLWTAVKMMSTAWTGILLTPVFLLLSYFRLPVGNSLVYALIVIIFMKLLLFYKCFLIFFKKMGAFLQIFLYFCTLELVPPLILWGILVTIANYLKVNY
ncbi:MAG: DUF4271 domain-containing protein [Bacteroidales bacterium]|nr:DUF4271 domain-containing protein [Bacteroidales bacterium]MCM1146504.1 DUF4271 domain-containing protein [Bacteroidales bacterium]MCM1207222.1 DUF4271 domain-containing protein [Bacillota bacterium]MCM1509304.1 DUF4271 domain-containing protein [Clostridium sp.]